MLPARGRCAVCGDTNWRAVWRGHLELCICWRCAVEVLPRLIADATWRSHMTPADAAAIWTEARAEYWRAVAICAMRDGRASEHQS
jgi:hypothetical protein